MSAFPAYRHTDVLAMPYRLFLRAMQALGEDGDSSSAGPVATGAQSYSAAEIEATMARHASRLRSATP